MVVVAFPQRIYVFEQTNLSENSRGYLQLNAYSQLYESEGMINLHILCFSPNNSSY